jgi:hypothetical protein
MIEKMMQKAKFNAIDDNGNHLVEFEIDLLTCTDISFLHHDGYSIMFGKGLKNGCVRISETKEDVKILYTNKIKKVKIRSTSELFNDEDYEIKIFANGKIGYVSKKSRIIV